MKKRNLAYYSTLLVGCLIAPMTMALENSGFEAPDQGNSWSYAPAGSSWAPTASAGLSGPVGPWIADNTSPDPAGDQFAFLQRAASIQQDLAGLTAGLSYTISFFESYRVGTLSSNDLSVVLNPGQGDEQVIYNNPGITNRSWEARQTDTFTATGTSYTLMFRSTGPNNTDQTSLIDGVIVQAVDLPGAPTVTSLTPADNTTNVLVFTNLEIVFNEPVVTDVGNIVISNVTDSTTQIIPVSDPQITISENRLTIDPTNDLLPLKNYAVWMDTGALVDLATNDFSGFTNATDWTFTTSEIDVTTPSVTSLSPTNGAVEVARLPELIMTFDEPVKAGTGDIMVRRLSDDAIIETIPSTSGSVVFAGNNATIQTSVPLDSGTNYYVEVAATAIQDLSDNPYAGISGDSGWAFRVTEIRFEPITSDADSGINDVKTYTHAIDFGNNTSYPAATINGVVFANGGTGAFPATNGTSQTIGTGSSTLPNSNAGNGTANAFLSDPGMRNLVGDMIFGDVTSEIQLTGLTTGKPYQVRLYHRAWALNATRPQTVRFDTDGQVGAEYQTTFLEDDATAPNALLDTAGRVNALTLNYVANSSTLTINIDRLGTESGSYHFYALTNEEIVEDVPPNVASLDPADDAVDVRIYANLAATFDIPIQVGTGNITISNVTDGTTTVIPANSPLVTINDRQRVLTIDPASDFDNFENYAVLIESNAVLNDFGTPFAGITGDGTWTFTTEINDVIAPELLGISPTNESVEVSSLTDLTMTFNENVQPGTGTVLIKRVSNEQVIEAIDINSAQVTIIGTEVIIDPTDALDPLSEIYIEMNAGVIEDFAGNPFAGISGTTTWSFTTRTIRFLPVTGDADSGISESKLYTHAIDFGNNGTYPVATINGVVFANGGTGAFPATNGTSQIIGTGSSTLPNSNGGNTTADAFLSDPGMRNLVGDMIWGATSGEIQLTGLTTGKVYEVRLYNRAWGLSGDRDQTIGFSTDGVTGAEATARFNEDDATQFDAGLDVIGRVNIISYRYTATAPTLVINIDRVDIEDGTYHLYGLTNEEILIDDVPLLLALNPPDDAINVSPHTDLAMTFNTKIIAGPGNITISNTTDNTATTFAAIDPQVAFSATTLTITPDPELLGTKDYVILLDTNAVKNVFGTAFAGLTNASDWTFTTALADTNHPAIISLNPANGENAASVLSDFVIRTDESVIAASGNITLRRLSDDMSIETFDVTTSSVVVNGDEITVARSLLLDPQTSYYVEMDAGAFTDLAGNPLPGITGNMDWQFTTTETGTLTYTPINNDADSGISTNNTYTHTLDFGLGTPGALINGVPFAAYNNAANGTLNFMRTVSGGQLYDHAGNGNHNVTGSLVDLLTDMYYNGQNPAGAFQTWTLSGLTPGLTYDTRIYVRSWGASPGGSRLVNLVFDPDGAGPVADQTGFISEDDATTVGLADGNQAYYISYLFTAGPSGELVITATQQNYNNSWHLYGISNQEAGPRETFAFTDITYTPGPNPSASFSFNSIPGKTYRIEAKLDIHSSTWIELVDQYTSQGLTTTFTDTVAADMPRVYYRVRENE